MLCNSLSSISLLACIVCCLDEVYFECVLHTESKPHTFRSAYYSYRQAANAGYSNVSMCSLRPIGDGESTSTLFPVNTTSFGIKIPIECEFGFSTNGTFNERSPHLPSHQFRTFTFSTRYRKQPIHKTATRKQYFRTIRHLARNEHKCGLWLIIFVFGVVLACSGLLLNCFYVTAID